MRAEYASSEGSYYLVLNYCFLFLQYLHNRIDLFPALPLTDCLSSPRASPRGHHKPRALADPAMATQGKQRHSQSQLGSARAAAISFSYYSSHLSLSIFPHLFSLILSYCPANSAFTFSIFSQIIPISIPIIFISFRLCCHKPSKNMLHLLPAFFSDLFLN